VELPGQEAVDLSSCPDQAVCVRIENRTDRTFDHVVVGFPWQKVDYGRVPAHAFSSYRKVREAYRYAPMTASAKGHPTLKTWVIDYFGEDLVPPGAYTYRLGPER
jgi:hypothetical protein